MVVVEKVVFFHTRVLQLTAYTTHPAGWHRVVGI
jgi:hypothetical protein